MKRTTTKRIIIVGLFLVIFFVLIGLFHAPKLSLSDSEAIKNTVAAVYTENANNTQTVVAAGGPTAYEKTAVVEATRFQGTFTAWAAEWEAGATQTVTAVGGPTVYEKTAVVEATRFQGTFTTWAAEWEAGSTLTVTAAGGPTEFQKTVAAIESAYQATEDAIRKQRNVVNKTLFAPTLANMATRVAEGEDPHKLWLTLTPAIETEYPVTNTPLPQAFNSTPSISSAQSSPPRSSSIQTVIDWYQIPVVGSILANLKAIGGVELVVGVVGTVVGILITLTLTNFQRLIGLVGRLFGFIYAIVLRRGKDFLFEKEYLNWLIGQYRYLGLLPAQVVARRWGERQQFLDLEKIYVQLSFSTGGQQFRNSEKGYSWNRETFRLIRVLKNLILLMFRFIPLRHSWRDAVENSIFFFDPPYPGGSLGSTIDENNRLIIRGDPGSGKTTLMRYLALTCARSLRNARKEHDSRYLVRRRLLWKKIPFPIMVRLSKHSDVIEWKAERTLVDAFRLELPVDLRRRCPDGFFERQLHNRPCLILLDAYDELGSSTARSAMADYIKGFLDIYEKPKHRTVVTTRIVGYEGQLDKYGFQIRTMNQLQDGEIRALVKQRYKSITLVEQMGKEPLEKRTIENRLKDRAIALIKKIEGNSRMRQLSSNPMLLSLIVLVHFLKVELPDERVLLYRDCVEILTERWQRYKAEEDGGKPSAGQTLSLSQKITLLRELAYTMQLYRIQKSNQALIPHKTALSIIAVEIAKLLSIEVSTKGQEVQAEIERQASEWINGIQAESGILVEQGLDVGGEPLIGFSHLTFQEYLTALAISENPEYMPQLWDNLLNPAWREVVRLFVVLVEDASDVITKLLDSDKNLEGIFLAGECLTEKLRKVDGNLKDKVIEKLKLIFVSGSLNEAEHAISTLGLIGNLKAIQFIIDQIKSAEPGRQLYAIRALENVRTIEYFSGLESSLDEVRTLLLQMLDTDCPIEIKIIANEVLALIGDPRFEKGKPLLISVPEIKADEKADRLISKSILYYYNTDTLYSKLLNSLALVFTKLNLRYYYLIRKIYNPTKKSLLDAFEISRYPITNIEYSFFIDETGHRYPTSWIEGSFPSEKATHPVVGIDFFDVSKYCAWLSKKTGDFYRLPTIWEWGVAAGDLEEKIYPWGNQFDSSKCNTAESEIGDTTPVGTYFDVKSSYGGQDFIGNVSEIIINTSAFFQILFLTIYSLAGIFVFIVIAFLLISAGELFKLFSQYGRVILTAMLDSPDNSRVFIVISSIVLTIFFTILCYFLAIRILTFWGITPYKKEYKKLDWLVILYYSMSRGLSWRDYLGKFGSILESLSFQRQKDDLGFRVVRQNGDK